MSKHRLYHIDQPEGDLFNNEDDIKEAIKSGWEDAPLNHPYRKVKKARIKKATSVKPRVETVKRDNKDSGII